VRARTIKAGRTLVVGETTFTPLGDDEAFALSVATFMAVPGEPPRRGEAIWGTGARPGVELVARIGAVELGPGVLELHRRPDLTNGPDGTFQGGISAVLGEVAAEGLLREDGAPWVVEHLDVRYLRGIRTGPARTTARVVGPRRPRATVVVEVHDAGADHLASYVVATARRIGT
jgi:acyl-coenzyme A thioesterase PaaI-like protein